MTDVAAVINFHAEGLMAPVSIASYAKCCDHAARNGLTVERIAILDRPDADTATAVTAQKSGFDMIQTVDYGDLGLARNCGWSMASAQYVAFFDGDDLWGDEWLTRAHARAHESADSDRVYHPQVIYYFSAEDYAIQSLTEIAPAGARSCFVVQADTQMPGFDATALIFGNLWTANAFAPRHIHERYPYRSADASNGLGIEDWTWYLETVAAGIGHTIVPDTVHCVRLGGRDSLGSSNDRMGTLPSIHSYGSALEVAAGRRPLDSRTDASASGSTPLVHCL